MTTLKKWRRNLDENVGTGKFQELAADVSQYLHEKLLENGEEARATADMLHGKQLGHPLHPVLTDLTIGGWTLGVFFDVLAFLTRSSQARKTGDRLTALGTLTALPTALTGMTDYSGIKKESAGYAAAHGLLNGMAFFCFVNSMLARTRNNRSRALYFSLLGLAFTTISAWIGGDMVYRQRVGVNNAPEDNIDDWTPVMDAKKLKEGVPARVEVGEQYVLLYRDGARIHAIGAICSHASGPLEQGTFKDGCVECPWHQSVYDLRDGHVVHGPSAFNQPRFSARVHNGQVEVRSYTGEENYSIQVDAPDNDELEIELEIDMPHNNGTGKKPARTRQPKNRLTDSGS